MTASDLHHNSKRTSTVKSSSYFSRRYHAKSYVQLRILRSLLISFYLLFGSKIFIHKKTCHICPVKALRSYKQPSLFVQKTLCGGLMFVHSLATPSWIWVAVHQPCSQGPFSTSRNFWNATNSKDRPTVDAKNSAKYGANLSVEH